MTTRNIEAFNNTIELMRKHPDEYEQRTFGERAGWVIDAHEYIDMKLAEPICGTRFCIGGSALLANGYKAVWYDDNQEVDKFVFETPDRNYNVEARWDQMVPEGAHILGLTQAEATRLFNTTWHPNEGHTVLTALEAIRDGADPLTVGYID